MLSLREVKALMDEPDMSDKEAEEIRNDCYALAEIALDIWKEKNTKNPTSPNFTTNHPHDNREA